VGARPYRCDVQIGRAPHAAVHVIPAPDPPRPEQHGYRARGSYRVGDIRVRRAWRSEHHPVPRAGVHRHHSQAAIEPRAERGHARTQVIKGYPAPRQLSEKGGARQRAARPRRPQRGAHRRHGTVKRNPGQPFNRCACGAHRDWRCLLGQAGHLTWPPRRAACRKPGRDDRARGGADEMRALPEVDTALLAGAGQEARQPRFPKRSAHGQDQYVGWLHA